MDENDGGAEVLVQLISPEELPVCECLHHEEKKRFTQPRSSNQTSAEGQQWLLLFLQTWHPPYFIFLISILEVRLNSLNRLVNLKNKSSGDLIYTISGRQRFQYGGPH
jgi:hypothetical protein